MVQPNLQKLFEKQMNRKEFLAHIGAGALMVLGVSGLIKNLLNYSGHSNRRTTVGYSSGSYGGKAKR